MGLLGMKFDRNFTLNNSNVSLPRVREYTLLMVCGRIASFMKLVTQFPWIQSTEME
jgi:hypothetical protein